MIYSTRTFFERNVKRAGVNGGLPGRDPPRGSWFFFPFWAFDAWLIILLWFNRSTIASLPILAFLLLSGWLESIRLIQQRRHHTQQLLWLRHLVQRLGQEREEQALALSSQWQTASTLQTLGYYAAAVLHNLSGPLSTLSNIVTEIGPQLSNRQRSDLESCLGYACSVLRQARSHLKNEPATSTNIKISAVFSEVQHVVHHLLVRQQVELRLFCPVDLTIAGDLTLLRQVLLNLVQNSLEALIDQSGGKISLRATQQKRKIMIMVKDNGKGMSTAQLRRLGQRFYTQKRGGTGLGVAFVQETIQKKFGGECQYESQLNHGTTVTVILPVGITKTEKPTVVQYNQ